MAEFEVNEIEKSRGDPNFNGYNVMPLMDIKWVERLIPLDKINTDGNLVGINSRPLRNAHTNKIKANYTGDTPIPKVMWHSGDDFYYVVEGQHVFEAWLEHIKEGNINIEKPCDIKCLVMQDASGRNLDGNIIEDKETAYMYSFRMNDGQERNCISDVVGMIMVLSDKYIRETGKRKGVIGYIIKNQCSHKILTEDTIKKYHSLGEKLKRHDLLEKAQLERWTMIQIEAEINHFTLEKPNKKKVSLNLYKKDADKFKELKFDDCEFWSKIIDEGITPGMILGNLGLI